MKEVQALPAEEQIKAVSKKLVELNPGFDGKVTGSDINIPPKIENGLVTEFGFCTDSVTNLSPVRALVGLKHFCCSCSGPGKGKVSDLSPLAGLKLATFNFGLTQVSDLSPLSGMPLTKMICVGTQVSDLSPLRGMPLTSLYCSETPVSDLSPLQGMNFTNFSITPKNITKGMDTIRKMKTLKVLGSGVGDKNKFPPDEFWKKYDAGEFGKPDATWNTPAFQQWVKATQALPAEQQIEAVSKKLMELNPGFDGKMTGFDWRAPPKIENGVVTEIGVNSDKVSEISPVRALVGLKGLKCDGSNHQSGTLSDLSPLKGMHLERLTCGYSKVGDLSPLQGMPLNYLACAGAKAADLRPLEGMALTALSLNGNANVSDLSPLKGMPLATLSVNNTQVSDLSALTMCTTLTSVTLYRSSVTPAGVAALQKALPNCKIEWDDAAKPATAGLPVNDERANEPKPLIAPFDAKQAHAGQEAWAKHLGKTVEQTNLIGMTLVLIPPGEFLMGSTPELNALGVKIAEEIDKLKPADAMFQWLKEEMPQHRVALTKPLLMGMTEITIGQFKKFVEATSYVTEAEQYGFGDSVGKTIDEKVTPEQKKRTWQTPGYAVNDDSPVTQVTWNDAVQFCNWLSEQENLKPCYRKDADNWILLVAAGGYRLPTEAEWEYACRAGTTTQFWFGDDVAELEQHEWYGKNAGGRARAVGLKSPNPFGLYDMAGNVREWCWDNYDGKWYDGSSPPNNPTGPSAGSSRVIRGGNWSYSASYCRSACRVHSTPSNRYYGGGFRPVRAW